MDTDAVRPLSPEQLAALRQRVLASLYTFAKGVLGYDRLNPRIHKPLCRLLEQYESKPRLKIVLPRGWYKTTLASIAYPIWRACRDSNVRILVVQNTHTNAIGKLSAISRHFQQNKILRALFPEVLPDKSCEWTREKMCLRRTGNYPEATFEAAGTGTQLTSRHFTCIIEDDTVAPHLDELGEENLMPSKDDIGQAIGFHKLMTPLLTNPKADQILVIGTRWFEKDLISWNDEHEPWYETYRRSCRELPDGSSDESGEVTFPEQFDATVLQQIEAGLGPYMFSCLYLNKPIRSGDMLFQLEWFKYYETEPMDLVNYTTVDPSGDPEESKGEPDWNVVATCGKSLSTGIVYVLEVSRKRCNPSEMLDMLFSHIHRYRPIKVGIESVAYQQTILHWAKQRMKDEQCWTMFQAITHGRKSKNARIMGLQPPVKAGTLRFRPSQRDVISEAMAFPYGKHDDILDCISMQHGMWALTPSALEPQRNMLPNPGTLEAAIDELRSTKRNTKSLLSDLYVIGSAKAAVRGHSYAL